MTEFLSTDSMRKIVDGQMNFPEINEEGMITLKSTEPQGSFSTHIPDLRCNISGQNNSFKYEISLPSKIEQIVGEGYLVISVEANGNWSFLTDKNKTESELYRQGLNMSAAEQFCHDHGGHLASIGSREETYEVLADANANDVWLGGH